MGSAVVTLADVYRRIDGLVERATDSLIDRDLFHALLDLRDAVANLMEPDEYLAMRSAEELRV